MAPHVQPVFGHHPLYHRNAYLLPPAVREFASFFFLLSSSRVRREVSSNVFYFEQPSLNSADRRFCRPPFFVTF